MSSEDAQRACMVGNNIYESRCVDFSDALLCIFQACDHFMKEVISVACKATAQA